MVVAKQDGDDTAWRWQRAAPRGSGAFVRADTTVALLLVAACNSSTTTTTSGTATATASITASASASHAKTPTPAPSASQHPWHTSPVAKQHSALKQPPPPRPKRAQPARIEKGDDYELTISDITVTVGKDAVASIEIEALGDWKFNSEFPVRALLNAPKFAATPALTLRSTKPAPNGFQVTSGGVRVDIAFTGSHVGTDELTADIRFGICSDSACELREHKVAWKVAVTE